VTTPTPSGLPSAAAWEHLEARAGFEVVFLDRTGDGVRVVGSTSAVEDGDAWFVRYVIDADGLWRTRRAEIWGRSGAGAAHRVLEGDGESRWLVDGSAAPDLEGCLDVDLESSACTNTLAVHRLGLADGESADAPAADAPAAYVRADGLAVMRLEQTYERPAVGAVDDVGRLSLDYQAPAFGYTARLVFDDAGLIVDYPGLARRSA
jgi:uncharacterized protein